MQHGTRAQILLKSSAVANCAVRGVRSRARSRTSGRREIYTSSRGGRSSIAGRLLCSRKGYGGADPREAELDRRQLQRQRRSTLCDMVKAVGADSMMRPRGAYGRATDRSASIANCKWCASVRTCMVFRLRSNTRSSWHHICASEWHFRQSQAFLQRGRLRHRAGEGTSAGEVHPGTNVLPEYATDQCNAHSVSAPLLRRITFLDMTQGP